MDLTVYIQLIFLCVVNAIFTFFGIILNTLVIASFWKSPQLRKKLCHFMIMVLSCFDLVAVITNHPGALLHLISWLTEDYDLLLKMGMYLFFSTVFHGFSFLVLLLMSIERYLGAYYPIFHRRSVTRHRLFTLLAILFFFHTVLLVISINDFIITETVHMMIFMIATFPPFVFINLKLFKISRELRQKNAISRGKRTINLKSISTCLLAVVACFALWSIPLIVFIIFTTTENESTSAMLSYIWATTTMSTNSTFNTLIFFWKNKVLRNEGIKILKTLKDRLVGF